MRVTITYANDLGEFWIWRQRGYLVELLRPNGKWERVEEFRSYEPTVVPKREVGDAAERGA